MGDLGRALTAFGKAYLVAVVLLGLLAYAVARVASLDAISLYQLLLGLMGVGYVFASVLAWTGFANIYRYSPTLYFGSMSYRRSVVRGELAAEGRDSEALAIGTLFGLSLAGSAVALLGWLQATFVIAVAAAALLYARHREALARPPT